MFLSGKKESLTKKAYELAYALCRVSEKVGGSFGETLKGYGIDLLGAVSRERYEEAEPLIAGIDYFVKLGVDMNYISPRNGDVFSSEIGGFRPLLADCIAIGNTVADDVSIDDIFSKLPSAPSIHEVPSTLQRAEKMMPNGFLKKISGNSPIVSNDMPLPDIEMMEMDIEEDSQAEDDEKGGVLGDALSAGIEIRQSAILDRIRQSGNCRMKDFLEILPSSSERTIRYDLESLIERRLIERIGGGSATYYRPLD